jgi:hypothetical protein
MGIDCEQKPTLKKTGKGSSESVISNTFALLSSNASSSQDVDLIPTWCKEEIVSNEWLNSISIIKSLKSSKATRSGGIPLWCD